jgi:hypothetical protein
MPPQRFDVRRLYALMLPQHNPDSAKETLLFYWGNDRGVAAPLDSKAGTS